MKYRVETIGAAFNDKGIAALSDMLTSRSSDGWEFHSVFSVEKRGCLGAAEGTTYLAVFKRAD
jgi:Domain of unknown function (DUF4177)